VIGLSFDKLHYLGTVNFKHKSFLFLFQVEYSSIVGLMFDIHHFGFCSYGCLFFDADRLFRAVASPYFALDDAYTPHLLARLL
jgi:hypothetical protein